jgi:coenzyme F420-0:L-glutamate ligase/coenzyme F420-1:gamma-L-glutamate ligase
MALTFTPLLGIPLVHSGNSLSDILFEGLRLTGIDLEEGDILVLAQKIVSKAEGRRVNLKCIVPGPEAIELARRVEKDPRFIQLVLQESREVMRCRPGTLIVEHRLGFVCANAGIDQSNVDGEGDPQAEWVLLLPEAPDASAEAVRKQLEDRSGVKLGVLIIDSHGRAWRNGVVGITIGLSGLPGLIDLRGQEDLFGYKLRITLVAAADELAAGASLVMGQAGEGFPAVHVRGFPYPLRESGLYELIRPRDQDLFR